MDKAPFFDEIAQGPANGQALWVHASDGTRLRLGLWPAAKDTPELGCILLFPGRTEYIEKYGPTAVDLTTMGYAVLTIDWRGQGLSDRTGKNPMIGHVGGFEEFQLDLACMMQAVRELGLSTPLYLLSHSMGGCIALRALHQGLTVKAAVFSSPMWGIHVPIGQRSMAWTTSWLFHKLTSGDQLAPSTKIQTYVETSPFEDNQLTTDPDKYAFLQMQAKAHPELVLGGPSMSWLYTALYETRDLTNLPAPSTPCLTYLGTQERIVQPGPIHTLMQRWNNGRLEMLEGSEHEVLLERPATRARIASGLAELFAAHR